VRVCVRTCTCVCLYMCVCMVWYSLSLSLLMVVSLPMVLSLPLSPYGTLSPSPSFPLPHPLSLTISRIVACRWCLECLSLPVSFSCSHSLSFSSPASSSPTHYLTVHVALCMKLSQTDTPSSGATGRGTPSQAETHPHRQRHDRQTHTLHRGPRREQGSKDCCLWCFQIVPLCLLPLEDKICVRASSERQRKPQTRTQTRTYTGRHLLLKIVGLRVCAGQLLMTPPF
jgi:hypothetical protein